MEKLSFESCFVLTGFPLFDFAEIWAIPILFLAVLV
jgi:hypothetical protein